MSLELVTHAAAYAAEAHVRQKRKQGETPYINHPLRVAHQAVKAGLSAEAVAAALLHDVVEDTDYTLDDIAQDFPARVVKLVDLLTKWWPDDAPGEIKKSEKPKYYGAILKDSEAIDLKLLDRADNLCDMVRMLPRARGWAERYWRKTSVEVAPIYDASRNPFARSAYERALNDLERALALHAEGEAPRRRR